MAYRGVDRVWRAIVVAAVRQPDQQAAHGLGDTWARTGAQREPMPEASKPLRIAFVDSNERGGLVHYTHELCNCLSEAGHAVTFLSAKSMELSGAKRTYALKRVFDIDRPDRLLLGRSSPRDRLLRVGHRARSLASFAYQHSRVLRHLIGDPPDVVVVGTIFRYPLMGTFVEVLARRGIKVVQVCHEFQNRTGAGGRLTDLLIRMNRRGYRSMHRIFFLSRHLSESFAKAHPEVDPKRLKVLPVGNGRLFEELASTDSDHDVLRRLQIDPEMPFLLFYGRIREDKGVLDLVEAFAILGSEFQRYQLVLLGESPANLTATIRDLITQHDLGDRVIFNTGYYDMADLWAAVRNAAVTVFPYRSGSQSAALQVAMFAGSPIVASTVGGLPEVVHDGVNGLLCDPADAESLAHSLRAMLDAEVATRLGEGAAAAARSTHAWSRIAERLVAQLND